MKKSTKSILWAGLSVSLFSSLFITSFSNAQEYGNYANDGYNHSSVRPVHESHIMYQKSLWHRISLKEKQNRPFFATGNEITGTIINAVKLGIVRPYQNDSLATRMSEEDFLSNIKIPSDEIQYDGIEADIFNQENDNTWGDEGTWEDEETGVTAQEFYANQLYTLEIKTNVFFDKKRSRMINDIQTISIILPAEMNPQTGLEKTIATFSYKELVQNLFRDNPSAIYYNERNNQAHRNLEEAFDLMLANGTLIKYGNGKDEHIMDMYDNQHEALLASQNYDANSIEYESNLWEN
ncbi:gliding motility associated protein GldN [Bernardetia litoralis DSM 6794]|uniref:Gliding motility associated protein GldN n=1 Tax=Bernardetia litoralis (strain ATCC 23117 / DSM 6794 / NBRC 15988 / NCIMB 1366 / Fx l1 / Sio-4) TaxID=880071 RepID=I4AJY7_BERLS|nr:gliding motility protein GldN [Bernardetia litoralis]AFM04272.1 gliding motility associated protein GldN [Bernardetia litoralis DSM 6794]